MNPILNDVCDVHSRGDKLGELWWQGRQWAVTADGLECRDGTYFIAKERLKEHLDRGYSWVAQIGGKEWVDIADFSTAYLIACALHGARLKVSEREMLRKHVDKVIANAARDAARRAEEVNQPFRFMPFAMRDPKEIPPRGSELD
jgi:hypothetical protein